MLVDSGSPPNIITQKTFEALKEAHAQLVNERQAPNDEQYQGYGSETNIIFDRAFEAEVKYPGQPSGSGVWAHILVAPHGQTNILSQATAFALGVLNIGYYVNAIEPTPGDKEEEVEFPKVPGVKLKIHMDPSVRPIIQPIRRLPIAMEAEVETLVQELYGKGIIEKVDGPTDWVSPLVPIRKKDGSLRLCVDLRAVNQAVRTENYPMPNIENALASIRGAAMLSTVDLESAFYHLELDPESRNVSTFTTRSGLYRFTRLVFGIKSAPELFQKTMDLLFGDIKNIIIYLDDILIFGATVEEHDEILKTVLERLKELGIRVNQNKSVFRAGKVKFLGHMISKNGVSLTESKVKAFQEMREPNAVAELRSLLGMINFMGKFIPNLSERTQHMRSLLLKDQIFKWGAKQTEELRDLKKLLTAEKCLKYFDPKHETLLITDASPHGLGAILAQTENGVTRPVLFASRSLSTNEAKYCQTERECLGIIWAIEKLYIYLYGTHFTLITDCKPLQYLFNRVQSKPSARIERWILKLQGFDFTVRYEQGDRNLADALSRLTTSNHGIDAVEPDMVAWIATEMMPRKLNRQELDQASAADPELGTIREALATGDWTEVPPEYKISQIKDQLLRLDDLILRGDRILVPKSLRERIVQTAHIGHQGSTSMKAQLRSRLWFPGLDKMIDKVVRGCKFCTMMSLADKPGPMTRRQPTEPWQDIAMDFKEGLPNGESILVVVCYTTRYIQIEYMKNPTSEMVIQALLKMFSSFGIPHSLTADNGSQFRSKEFREFCKAYDIHLNLSTPYWPEQNGAVERQNRNIGKRIKISIAEGTDWKRDLYEYLLLYHATPQETTGVSPSKLMFNREMNGLLPTMNDPTSIFHEGEAERDMVLKEAKKCYADERRGAKANDLSLGDTVLMKNIKRGALQPNFSAEEFEVTRIQGNEVDIKSTSSDKLYKRNRAHLKKLKEGRGDIEREEESPEALPREQDPDMMTMEPPQEDQIADNEDEPTGRPQRKRALPARLRDYQVSK